LILQFNYNTPWPKLTDPLIPLGETVLSKLAQLSLLLLSQELWITIFLAYGYLILDQKKYGKAFFLLLFTMVYNTYLKSIWQIPLPATLMSQGWCFPSGHMHVAIVLWGWLAWEYGNYWLMALLAVLWAGAGFALVDLGYHYPVDIWGAWLFGLVSLLVYGWISELPYLKQRPPILGVLLAIIAAPMAYLLPAAAKQAHVWLSLGGLLGFSLGWTLSHQWPVRQPISIKGQFQCLLLMCLGLGLVDLLSFGLANYLSRNAFFEFSRFFAMALWISLGSLWAWNKWFLSGSRTKIWALHEESYKEK